MGDVVGVCQESSLSTPRDGGEESTLAVSDGHTIISSEWVGGRKVGRRGTVGKENDDGG